LLIKEENMKQREREGGREGEEPLFFTFEETRFVLTFDQKGNKITLQTTHTLLVFNQYIQCPT
jgi:hypothetical protein